MALQPQRFLSTRRSLLSRLRNWDDRESWEKFFDTYSNLIYRTAIWAGLNEWEAQEVLQETLIVAAKKLPKFKYDSSIGSFRGWLLRTTRWRIEDQFRKRRLVARRWPERKSETDRTGTVARIPDPRTGELEAGWNREWKQNLLEAALERVKRSVSANQYQIFDLYVIKHWPAGKVAETLGISAGQVFLAKHRVLPLLKREVHRLEENVC